MPPHAPQTPIALAMSPPPSASLVSRDVARRCVRVLAACVAWLAVVFIEPVHALEVRSDGDVTQARGPTEWELKAALLYKFVGYVTWPSASFPDKPVEKTDDKTTTQLALAPLIVGVVGRDPFGAALDGAFKDKLVNSRAVVIKRCANLDEAALCHVVYVASTEKADEVAAIKALGQKPVLLVGDAVKFAQRGGHIGFYFESNKIRFAINNGAAKKAKLDISSQLLKLAKLVETEPEE
jgi:hypothetical protein